jgi:uncharacterized protein (TIGR03067 family)
MIALLLVVGFLFMRNSSASDLDDIQGTWNLYAAPKLIAKLTITNNKYTYRVINYTDAGTIVLDPSKDPKHIDFVISQGQYRGKTRRGIYKFVDSKLILCVAAPDKDRPSEFKDEPGKGHILWEGSK